MVHRGNQLSTFSSPLLLPLPVYTDIHDTSFPRGAPVLTFSPPVAGWQPVSGWPTLGPQWPAGPFNAVHGREELNLGHRAPSPPPPSLCNARRSTRLFTFCTARTVPSADPSFHCNARNSLLAGGGAECHANKIPRSGCWATEQLRKGPHSLWPRGGQARCRRES